MIFIDSFPSFCSLRYGFVQCVMQITHRKCDAEDPGAARFIQQMAETLLRSRIHGHPPEQCVNITLDHCPMKSEASKLILTIKMMTLLNVIYTVLIG